MEKHITASIPAHIHARLHSGESGEIILVSSAGIYLKFDGRILLLCDQSWGVLPIGIGIRDFQHAVYLLNPQQGQQVTVSEEYLIFPFGRIRLELQNPPCEALCDALPQRGRIRQAAQELASLHKERGISMLVQPLVLDCALDDTLQKDPYCANAHLYFSKLVAAFAHSDSAEIRNCTKKLLGLGLGLTPSADDVILGMLYVFRALPQKRPEITQIFQKCVGQLCECCTNQISAAYLKAILAGAPFERMDAVFRGICAAQPLDIQKLTQIGSSSGTEMLLGMLIALRICGYDVSQKEELQ